MECVEPRDPNDPAYAQFPLIDMCRVACSSPPPTLTPPSPPSPTRPVASPLPSPPPPSPYFTVCDTGLCGLPAVGCFSALTNVPLNFTAAVIRYSNLGGLGPDFAQPPKLVFSEAGFCSNGCPIDLEVSNASQYVNRNPYYNGITAGAFGEINLAGGSSVRLRFDFVDSEFGEPVVLDQVYFSVYDLDEGYDGASRETISVSGFDSYVYPTDAALDIAFNTSLESVRVTSLEQGSSADNPTSPTVLTDVQRRRTIQFSFVEIASFELEFGLSSSFWGRGLIFSGEKAFELPHCPYPAPPSSLFPPPPPQAHDPCPWESDGECDDGGAGSEYSLCASGTDATDCDGAPPPPSPPLHPTRRRPIRCGQPGPLLRGGVR